MLALETLLGLRVVASPDALDAARWDVQTALLRIAPDDTFAVGATTIDLLDAHAIVTEESGFVGAWLMPDQLAELVISHIEWPLPDARPALAQGLIAGVPAKLWLDRERALLLCAAGYAHELTARLR
ncbi:MAG: hypothetical protein M3406_09045 [Chloroflexota bacterium]|nr:hypothetical protein [Chloroflexota bacterium]